LWHIISSRSFSLIVFIFSNDIFRPNKINFFPQNNKAFYFSNQPNPLKRFIFYSFPHLEFAENTFPPLFFSYTLGFVSLSTLI
jgi:hypothetical protein